MRANRPRAGDSAARARALTRRIRHAALWKTPRSPLVIILALEALAVTWLSIANAYESVSLSDLRAFGVLLGVSFVYIEAGARIERLRRFVDYVQNSTFANAASLWCFASALVLPIGLAGAFTAAIYTWIVIRSVRARAATPHRLIYTATTEVLAAMCAASVVVAFDGPGVTLGSSPMSVVTVAAALFTYTAVNQSLVVLVVAMITKPAKIRSAVMSPEDQTLEFATLSLGVLLALALVHAPYLAPVTLPLIVVLRRSALVRQLQVQATLDAKTGLLNAAAWRREADREIANSERVGASISVLMIDLDHFKQLNDRHGHQAGDATLKQVGDCLVDALRSKDIVGRFGGEEFIALLPAADESVAANVAERLRQRISALELSHGGSVTASIGVATGAEEHGLDNLISVADRALYAAKSCGRNQVRSQRAGTPGAAQMPAAELDDAAFDRALQELIRDTDN
jgi:diguanylate cyclase (GGDEF)-like protein